MTKYCVSPFGDIQISTLILILQSDVSLIIYLDFLLLAIVIRREEVKCVWPHLTEWVDYLSFVLR
jgi:hypothetical protein